MLYLSIFIIWKMVNLMWVYLYKLEVFIRNIQLINDYLYIQNGKLIGVILIWKK